MTNQNTALINSQPISYEAIEGGMPIEAMVDLTGGLAERYELRHKDKHRTLYKYLRKSFASQVTPDMARF